MATDRPGGRIDRLGALMSALGVLAVVLAPFLVLKANRLASGTSRAVLEALPPWPAYALLLLLAAIGAIIILSKQALLRLAAAVLGLIALALAAGYGASWLIPSRRQVRPRAPGAAFWLLLFALALVVTDALARLRPGPWARVAALVVAAGRRRRAACFGCLERSVGDA